MRRNAAVVVVELLLLNASQFGRIKSLLCVWFADEATVRFIYTRGE